MSASLELERLPISLVLTHDGTRQAFWVYPPTLGAAVAVMQLLDRQQGDVDRLVLRRLLATFMPRRAAHWLAVHYHAHECSEVLGALFTHWMPAETPAENTEKGKEHTETPQTPKPIKWHEAVAEVAHLYSISPFEIWTTWTLPFFMSMMRQQARLSAMAKMNQVDLISYPHLSVKGADAVYRAWRKQAGMATVKRDLEDTAQNKRRNAALVEMFYSITQAKA